MECVIQNLVKLERAIRDRSETDKPLVGWWLYILLLSWITFYIYPIVLYFQRIKRRDSHFSRMKTLFSAAVDSTKEIADARGVDIHHEITDIENELRKADEALLKPKGAGLWLVLTFVSFGLAGFYVMYFLTTDWRKLQELEQVLLDDLSKIWVKLKIINHPISADLSAPERNYFLYLFLSVVTLGVWGVYWDHCIHTDPDKVFKENVVWEDMILNGFRQVELEPSIAEKT